LRPKLAALLLLLASTHELFWRFFPPENQAEIWQITGGLSRACLVFVIGLFAGSRLVWFVVSFAAGLDLQVAWCAGLYIYSPWEIKPGQDVCTSRYEIPFALLFCWFALALAQTIRRALRDRAPN